MQTTRSQGSLTSTDRGEVTTGDQRAEQVAYCFASGLIGMGATIPDGALPLMLKGEPTKLRDFLDGVARHGYSTELVNGRRTKIPGTETLLVPGIPEAPDQDKALDALHAFIDWIKPQAERAGVQMPVGLRRRRAARQQ